MLEVRVQMVSLWTSMNQLLLKCLLKTMLPCRSTTCLIERWSNHLKESSKKDMSPSSTKWKNMFLKSPETTGCVSWAPTFQTSSDHWIQASDSKQAARSTARYSARTAPPPTPSVSSTAASHSDHSAWMAWWRSLYLQRLWPKEGRSKWDRVWMVDQPFSAIWTARSGITFRASIKGESGIWKYNRRLIRSFDGREESL